MTDTLTDNDKSIMERYAYAMTELQAEIARLKAEIRRLSAPVVMSEEEKKALDDALRGMQLDAHYFSGRPCATCRKLSVAWGENYGCYIHPKQTDRVVFSLPKISPSAKSCGHGPDMLKVTDLYCAQCVEEAK